MKHLALIITFISTSVFANDAEFVQVRESMFWPQVYADKFHTLYCAVNKRPGLVLAVERVYAANWIANAQGCDSHKQCNVGQYKTASSDLHNFWPALKSYTDIRNNLPYGEISGEQFYLPEDQCDLERTDDVIEPRPYARGEIARSILYMMWKYKLPDQGMISLMVKWSNKYKVSAEEKMRNEKIAKLQGNKNPFIDDPDMAELYQLTR